MRHGFRQAGNVLKILQVFQVLRDLLGSDGSQLVHVIKHDDAWGTCVTNLTLMEALAALLG